MKSSIMRLLAAIMLVAAVFAYQSEQKPAEASGCFWTEIGCYLGNGVWQLAGSSGQCWNGQWNIEYICYNYELGLGQHYWCEEGGSCTVCNPGESCNG